MSMYDVQKAATAQVEYCKAHNMPHFAPRSGRCWSCDRNTYQSYTRTSQYGERTTGITVEEAGTTHVVYCPHCNRSYCD